MARKIKKVIPETGRVYVHASFNNTIITITDTVGKVLFWGSAGTAGFKGTRKSTPFAAAQAVRNVAERAKNNGMQKADVFIKGPGLGRDAAIRALKNSGLQILSLSDITPVPHNGRRLKKRRRV